MQPYRIGDDEDEGELIRFTVAFAISADYRLVENKAEAAFMVCEAETGEWVEVDAATGRCEEIVYH